MALHRHLHPAFLENQGPWYLPRMPSHCHLSAYASLSLPLNVTEMSWSPEGQWKVITITKHNPLSAGSDTEHGDPRKYERSLLLGRRPGCKSLGNGRAPIPTTSEWPRRKQEAGRKHSPRDKGGCEVPRRSPGDCGRATPLMLRCPRAILTTQECEIEYVMTSIPTTSTNWDIARPNFIFILSFRCSTGRTHLS